MLELARRDIPGVMFDGRPVYRIGGGGGRGGGRGRGAGAAMVFADDGTKPPAVDDAMIDRAAATAPTKNKAIRHNRKFQFIANLTEG